MRTLMKFLLAICVVAYGCGFPSSKEGIEVDVCVYGGTASGVIAAYSAKMMGKSVVLVEPGRRLGGLLRVVLGLLI